MINAIERAPSPVSDVNLLSFFLLSAPEAGINTLDPGGHEGSARSRGQCWGGRGRHRPCRGPFRIPKVYRGKRLRRNFGQGKPTQNRYISLAVSLSIPQIDGSVRLL